MFLKRWFIVLMMLPVWAMAQVVDAETAAEDWLGEDASEAAAAEMGDEWMQLLENPVNINDTVAMTSLPFISPFQYISLRNYIMLYGQLMSLKELAFVPGFDSATVALIEPLIKVEPFENEKSFRLWEGHHKLVTGIGGTIEQAEGYGNGHYEGDNLRSMVCYSYDYRGKLSIRLAADKDPGEVWGKDNYYSYHVMLNDMGRLRRLVLGRYNLQLGQGLTLWTGLAPFNIAGVSPMRFAQGIKPAGAFYEEDYLEGAAATVDVWRGIEATVFASRVDGSNLLGGHVGYRRGNFIGGVTLAYSTMDDSVMLRDYVYNGHYFRGDRLMNIGADAMWQWRRLTLYGEVAMAGDSGAMAMAAGALVQADSRNRFGISVRHFDRAYHNNHAQAYAIGSTQNEEGMALDAIIRLPLKVDASLSLDLHNFASLRYGAYMPSTGQWLRLRLDRSILRNTSVTLRYSYRYKERNVPNIDSTMYIDEGTLRHLLQGELRTTQGRWAIMARGVVCRFDAESGIRQTGCAVGLTSRYTHRRFQATVAATWYDVDGYYARIYLSESNLQYVWNMPALNGRGLRTYALVRYILNDNLTLAAKYSLLFMPGQEGIGSGDSRTDGNHRQMWYVQLRLKL